MTGEAFSSDAEDRSVQEHVLGYWTRFAGTGDPNRTEAVAWPAVDPAAIPGDEPFLIVDPEISVGADLKAEVCDFWDNPAP